LKPPTSEPWGFGSIEKMLSIKVLEAIPVKMPSLPLENHHVEWKNAQFPWKHTKNYGKIHHV